MLIIKTGMVMTDIKILDAVERYIRGEMTPDERLQFENLRKTNTEIDQLVVEHTLFLQQLNHFGERKKFRSSLNDIHVDLSEQGKIDSMKLKGKAKVVYLWKRYRRVAAIAASIAGVTALGISALVWAFAPKANTDYDTLKREIKDLRNATAQQGNEIKNVKNSIGKEKSNPIIYKSGGTGFIIDAKGYLVTNFHVVQGAKNIAVQNSRGEFIARVVYTDKAKDIAILKIDDESFKPYTTVPYSISKSSARLAEPIFTLGYPKNEIVYGQGYLSSLTGFNGDTLSCQIEIAANHGNSGSPILNKNGEVVGILNARQNSTEGFTFAIQGKYIYKALDELKKSDTSYQRIKLSSKSQISGMDRTEQVNKVEDYIYMVKVN
ncbi:MAG: serine protease [Chitinophagaceae bacterium]